MNDLTQTPNSPPSKPTSPELGKALSALLDSEASPDAAVAAIVADPALVAECRAALPALKAIAEAKAGEDGVRRVIAKRFETYPQPQRTDEGWAAWWADYFDALADVGLASLEAGMRAYVAMPDSEFMPKPGRLRELAFSAPCRSLMRFYRASMALRQADYVPPVPLAPPTAEELAAMAAEAEANQAAIKTLFADFKVKAIPSAPSRPPLPYIGGVPDERGITPQMRELMAKRAE